MDFAFFPMPASNVTVTASFVEAHPEFAGNSLTLEGQIGENFVVNLDGADPSTASVTFTWDVLQADGTTKHNEQTVALSTLTPISDGSAYDGCYKVPVKVAAKEMQDSIHAVLRVGDQTIETDYSVWQYAERIFNNAGGEFDGTTALTELRELCRSMLAYCLAAQQQFNYNPTRRGGYSADPQNPQPVSFLLTDNFGWGTAYIYAWNADGDELNGAWPGNVQARTVVNNYGETQFVIEVPDGAEGVIVHNGSGAQTVDITDFSYTGYWMDGMLDAVGHYLVIGWN